MRGWMYRFADGPLAGMVGGPTMNHPPGEVWALPLAGGVACADAELVDEVPAGAHRYRRVRMSKLGDEPTPDVLVKGAEYEHVVTGEVT